MKKKSWKVCYEKLKCSPANWNGLMVDPDEVIALLDVTDQMAYVAA